MLEFCMEEYGITEDEALKRIQTARAARDFPVLFVALDEGRICLTRIRMLAPHLTPENMTELLGAAQRHHRLSDFRQFLNRFTKPDLLMGSPASSAHAQTAEPPTPLEIASGEVGAKEEVDQSHARGHVSGPPDRLDIAVEAPTGPPSDPSDWVTLRVKVPRARWEHLRNLLSHSVPSGDATKIFLRMLDATIEKEERRKFAACKKPRGPRPRVLRGHRTIPAHVRRAVVERDGGQCTFVSESGRRCSSRRLLEYDHITPVARGGNATIDGIRLRCRGHNQYEAEQAFGAEFMKKKREEARAGARAAQNQTEKPR
jgi:5-methylcytosine-specific restriction endonuclease McrA